MSEILVAAVRGVPAWLKQQLLDYHYLHTVPDVRGRLLSYEITLNGERIGGMVFARPEATRCYVGGLTYGSQADIAAGRAQYDRWELLNLARVWFAPFVQPGGMLYRPDALPGFTDRRGIWRSRLASWAIGVVLDRVRWEYLLHYPPVFLEQPYQIRVVLSYCDTRVHRGVLYQSSNFQRARINTSGIETWWKTLPALSTEQDAYVRYVAQHCKRGAALRARMTPAQEQLL